MHVHFLRSCAHSPETSAQLGVAHRSPDLWIALRLLPTRGAYWKMECKKIQEETLRTCSNQVPNKRPWPKGKVSLTLFLPSWPMWGVHSGSCNDAGVGPWEKFFQLTTCCICESIGTGEGSPSWPRLSKVIFRLSLVGLSLCLFSTFICLYMFKFFINIGKWDRYCPSCLLHNLNDD